MLLSSKPQLGEPPVQNSATSQTPCTPRHSTEGPAKPSFGQVPEPPVQVSATSQTPFAVRQVWPAALNWQRMVQHEVAEPFCPPRSHCSPTAASTTPLPHNEV